MTDQQKTLTRADISQYMHSRLGISALEASEFTDNLLRHMSDILSRGESIKIPRFGIFQVRRKNARIGRNPKNKIPALIKARTVVRFHPSQKLKALVNAYLHNSK